MCSLELRDYAAKLAALLQCDRASIWRVAQGGGERYYLKPICLLGVEAEQEGQISLPLNEKAFGLADTCAVYGEPFCINKTAEEMKRHSHLEEKLKYFVANSLVVPIQTKKGVIGVIQALNKKEGVFCHTDYITLIAAAKEISEKISGDQIFFPSVDVNQGEESIETLAVFSSNMTPILARAWNRLKTMCLIESFEETIADRAFYVENIFTPKLESLKNDLTALDAIVTKYRADSSEEFVADLCHQAKGLLDPLSGISTLSKVFGREAETKAIIRGNETILLRLNSVIEQMSRLYRKLRHESLCVKKIELHRLMEFLDYSYSDYFENFERNGLKANISLNVKKTSGKSCTVFTDVELLTEALETIMINAAEAIALSKAQNKGIISIDAKLSEDNRWLQISISDNGDGISDELKDSIFERGLTTKESGSGIGLFAVSTLVAKLRGKISLVAKCELGGAQFNIFIPLGSDNEDSDN